MAWHLSNTVARCSLESQRSLAGVPSSPIWSRSTLPAKRLPNLVIIRSPPSSHRGHQPAAVLQASLLPHLVGGRARDRDRPACSGRSASTTAGSQQLITPLAVS